MVNYNNNMSFLFSMIPLLIVKYDACVLGAQNQLDKYKFLSMILWNINKMPSPKIMWLIKQRFINHVRFLQRMKLSHSTQLKSTEGYFEVLDHLCKFKIKIKQWIDHSGSARMLGFFHWNWLGGPYVLLFCGVQKKLCTWIAYPSGLSDSNLVHGL